MADAAFTNALEQMDDTDLAFLAGLIGARGGFYVSESALASGGSRHAPALQIELAVSLDSRPRLLGVLGPGAQRRYYGRVAYRYSLQDREKIVAVIRRVYPFLLPLHQQQAALLAQVCEGDEAERAAAAEALRGKV